MIYVGDFKIEPEASAAIAELLQKGRISEGEKTYEFERAFAEYTGTKYCVATSSGTAALVAGLLALLYDERFPRFKPKAKIITTPLSYIATSNAIVLSGLTPVFVDVNAEDFTMNTNQVEETLKNNDPDDFAGILPVHLMGYPNDMDALRKISDKYNLVIFEDSSEAHGSLYHGKKCGGFGTLSSFSFYFAHNIQAGELGAVCTNDDNLCSMVRQLKANGRYCSCNICTRSKGHCPHSGLKIEGYGDYDFDPRFTHQYIGLNFMAMEFQTAIAITQVKKADQIFRKRLANVKKLNSILDGLQNLIRLPEYDENVSYLAYPIIIKDKKRIARGEFRHKLEAAGVESRPLFGSIPTQQPAYKHLKEEYKDKLPVADLLGANGLYVGCHQYLTDNDIEDLGRSIIKVLADIR